MDKFKVLLVIVLVSLLLWACHSTGSENGEKSTIGVDLSKTPAHPATAMSLPTSTPQPTPTMPPTAPVRRLDWNINIEPIIPTPTNFTPGEYGVGKAVMSQQGRMAVTVAGMLYVQSADGSDRYHEIAQDAYPVSWSPDGSMLLYCQVEDSSEGLSDILIYQAEMDRSVSLFDIIDNLSQGPNYMYLLGDTTWSFDSTKIYFTDFITDQLVTVDLVEGKMWHFINFKITNLWDFAPGFVIVENHCGSPCETFGAYTHSGEKIWGLPWATAGLFDISLDKSRLINTGRVDTHMDTLTIEEIDLSDGSMEVIWSLEDWSEGEYFTLFFPPALSDDEQYISFSLGEYMRPRGLMVIDRNGDVLAEIPDAVFPVWGRGLEMVFLLVHFEEEDYESLFYYNIEENRVVTLLEDVGEHSFNPQYYPDMFWSPDKSLFTYTSFDEAEGVAGLFIWDPALGESVLIFAEESEHRFSNLTWSPDSSRLYFLAKKGLLAYRVADESLIVIASMGN